MIEQVGIQIFLQRADDLQERLASIDPLSAESVLFYKLEIEKLRMAGSSIHEEYMKFLRAHRGLIDLEIELVKKVQVAHDAQ